MIARHAQSAAVLAALKVRPGSVEAGCKGGVPADLDSVCARRPRRAVVGAKVSLRRGRTKVRLGGRGWAPAWAGASKTTGRSRDAKEED
jgi:hypothetical protein